MSGAVNIYRANALRAYDEYFRLCIERPELSSFDMARRHLSLPPAQYLWESSDLNHAKYVWFVAYSLKVFDDLLEHDSVDDWRDAVLFQLRFHKEALEAIWPHHWSGIYNGQLGLLVDRVVGSNR